MTDTSQQTQLPALGLTSRAIFSPVVDLLLTSGISIVVVIVAIVVFLSTGQSQGEGDAILPKLMVLQVLLNWPHFLVSYKILYGRRENLRAYPLATLIVPAILLALAGASMMPAFGGAGPTAMNLEISYILWVFAALYLAWHYTGQAWGVMMTFSHLSGLQITPRERLVLRSGLRLLIVWHVVWGIETLPSYAIIAPMQTALAMTLANVLAIGAFLSGAITLFRIARRNGSLDLRIVGAWLALYLWYLLLWIAPAAFILVQFSHALQYMIFPARVELNTHRENRFFVKLGILYAACVAGGLLVFYLPEMWFISAQGNPTIGSILGILVNIHHYYTDSAIWKLRKSDVQKRLFLHLD
jgi:hypothetical protein